MPANVTYDVKVGSSNISASRTSIGAHVLRAVIDIDSARFNEPLTIPHAGIVLDNSWRDFTPNNSASPLYGKVAIGRTIEVLATYAPTSSTYSLFLGSIKSIDFDPSRQRDTCFIEAVGFAESLRRAIIRDEVLLNYKTSSLFGKVARHFTSPTSQTTQLVADGIDDTVYLSPIDNRNALEYVNELVEFGGYLAWTGANRIDVRGRYATLKATPSSSLSEFLTFSNRLNDKNVVNEIDIRGRQKTVSSSPSTVTWIQTTIALATRGETVVDLDYVDPQTFARGVSAKSMSAPTLTDYTVTDANGYELVGAAPITGQSLFATSARVFIYNSTTIELFATKLQIRGYAIVDRAEIGHHAEVASSQLLYGKRAVRINNENFFSLDYMRNMADWILKNRKDPRPEIEYAIRNIYPNVFIDNVGDTVHLTESKTGVASEFLIRGITHDIDFESGAEHTFTARCELVDPRDVMVLGDSTLGVIGQNYLGF